MQNRLTTGKKFDAYKAELYEEQGKECVLCGRDLELMPKQQRHLDHSHSDGHCRAILCCLCNSTEGKVFNRVNIIAKNSNISPIVWLRQLADYLEADYTDNPIHPTHLGDQIKRCSRLPAGEQKALIESNGLVAGANQKDRGKQFRKLLKEGKIDI